MIKFVYFKGEFTALLSWNSFKISKSKQTNNLKNEVLVVILGHRIHVKMPSDDRAKAILFSYFSF